MLGPPRAYAATFAEMALTRGPRETPPAAFLWGRLRTPAPRVRVSEVGNMIFDSVERGLFKAVNAVVRPAVRRGFAAPCLSPFGLVLLEHTGRKSGRTYESPLVALRLGRRVLVSTVRDERSEWVRNLESDESAHLWLNGRRRAVRAEVHRGPGLTVSVLEPA